MITPMQPAPRGVSAEVHQAIYQAIATLHVAEVEDASGHKRVGEPHDYGIINGKPLLLFYQTGGHSSSGRPHGWRTLDVTTFRAVRSLDKTFRGGRATETGQHRQWDQLFIRAVP